MWLNGKEMGTEIGLGEMELFTEEGREQSGK